MPPEMLHRTVPSTEPGTLADGAGDIGLDEWDGLAERAAERNVGSERGGERAAGPVGTGARHALGNELLEAFAVEEEVSDLWRAEMSALDDHRGRTQGDDSFGGASPVVGGDDRHS